MRFSILGELMELLMVSLLTVVVKSRTLRFVRMVKEQIIMEIA